MTRHDDTTNQSDDSTNRRRLLGTTAALALASLAGCTSNPWQPAQPENETGSAGDGTGVDASTTTDSTDGTTDESNRETEEDGYSDTENDASADDSSEENDDDSDGGDGEMDDDVGESGDGDSPEPTQIVEVAPDGFQYVPSSFEIEAGDTVKWVWKDNGHNVRVRDQPADAAWTGTPGSGSDTYAEGYEYSYTFEIPGEYVYFCAPHQSLGLEGAFTVIDS